MALPRGIRNNNPLNIKKGNNWKGERHPQSDKTFEEFQSITFGLRAGFKLIRNYITGFGGGRVKFDTIDKLVRRWAPPIENATENYIKFVADQSDINRYQTLYFNDKKAMCRIVRAMCYMECGTWIDMATIESAYDIL